MNNEKVKAIKVEVIKKALECCTNHKGQSSCKDCPIVEKCYEDENFMPRLALTLINALESENEHLRLERDFLMGKKIAKIQEDKKAIRVKIDLMEQIKARNAELERENAKYKRQLTTSQWAQEIRNEALKQFAEGLKEEFIKSANIQDSITAKKLFRDICTVKVDKVLKKFINEFTDK